MVDEELRPFLLEANTGPVLKEGDMEDMSMVSGLVEILFGMRASITSSLRCHMSSSSHS